jgi:PST family polysaccharide transporter
MREIVVLSLSARLLTVVAIFLFVKGPQDYRLAAGIQSSPTLIAGFAASFVISTLVNRTWEVPSWGDIWETLADGWHLFASNVAINLFTSSNVFILGVLCTPGVVGQFSAAEKLVRAVTALLSPISQAFYPYVARTAARSSNDALDVNRRLLHIQGAFTFGVSIVLLLLAGPIVLIVFGYSFGPAIALVRVMAFLPFIIGVSNVLGIQTMLNFGLTKSFSRILILSGVVNLTLLFILVPRWEAMGAAVGVVLSEFVVTVAMVFVVWRAGLLSRLIYHSAVIHDANP